MLKTALSGTPSISALVRSMSANRRGVRVLKVTKAPLIALFCDAALASSLATASRACGPWPPWSSTIIFQPPVEPIPRTDGGWMTRISAPVIGASFFFRSAMTSCGDMCRRARSSNDLRIR